MKEKEMDFTTDIDEWSREYNRIGWMSFNCRWEVIQRPYSIINVIEDGSDTLSIDTEAAPTPKEKVKPEEKETPEDIKKRSRKPPSEKTCKRCQLLKICNRQGYCYPCWVVVELQKNGWREGQPHPSGCGCDLDCRFDSKGADN